MASKSDLYDFLFTMDDDDLPDGAWMAIMEEHTETFNEANGTTFDFYDILEGYGKYKEKTLSKE